MSLLDIIFPKYCINCKHFGSYLCADCFIQLSFDTQVICLVCGRGSIDGLTHPSCKTKYSIDGVFCSVTYRKIAKKLIYVLKYQPYVSDIQHVLIDLMYESLIQKEQFTKQLDKDVVCIPIPLSSQKLKMRGYNQSKLLAAGLAKKLSLPVADILLRTKHTQPQFGLSKPERQANMQHAFAVKKRAILSHTAFLVDDVLTTGTTLSEAAKMLKRSGVQHVWGVTFARD